MTVERDRVLREKVALVGSTLHWTRTGEAVKGFRDRDGYHRFTIGAGQHGKVFHFAAHRVVWFLRHGAWPTHTIDHINRDRLDNRIENLRDVPLSVNRRNCVRPAQYQTSKSRQRPHQEQPVSSAKSQCPVNGALLSEAPKEARLHLTPRLAT